MKTKFLASPILAVTALLCVGCGGDNNNNEGDMGVEDNGPEDMGAPETPAQPCMLRIEQGETTFDQDYHIDVNELVDGYGGGLFQGPNGTAFITKYDDGMGGAPSGSFNAPVWRLHTIELGNEAATFAPVANLEPVARFVGTFDTTIDGSLVPFLVTEDESGGVYTSLADPSAPAAGLTVMGASFGHAALLRGGADPLWVATGWVTSGDEYNGFLATVGDLTSGTVDLMDAIDLGTDMSFGSDGLGNVFVGRDDSPVIEKWSLDVDGVLQNTGTLNLSSLGITSTMGGNRNVIQIISATRAYYFDNEGFRVVVFNPTDMTLTSNFSIDGIAEGVAEASLNFITREGDRFFASTRMWDAQEATIKELRVAIVNANDSTVTYATDERCGDMGFSVKDEEGNVYFGSHHSLAFFGSMTE